MKWWRGTAVEHTTGGRFEPELTPEGLVWATASLEYAWECARCNENARRLRHEDDSIVARVYEVVVNEDEVAWAEDDAHFEELLEDGAELVAIADGEAGAAMLAVRERLAAIVGEGAPK